MKIVLQRMGISKPGVAKAEQGEAQQSRGVATKCKGKDPKRCETKIWQPNERQQR